VAKAAPDGDKLVFAASSHNLAPVANIGMRRGAPSYMCASARARHQNLFLKPTTRIERT
jgi:hypothetical protein